jgi:hypothetical protein
MAMLLPLIVLLSISIGCFLLTRASSSLIIKIPLWLIGGCSGAVFLLLFLLTIFFWEQEPPSIATLAKHFAERQSTLEEIIAMSDQDKYFFRIDPTFLDYDYTQGKMDGKAVVGEDAAKMPPARLQTYRTLFEKAKLDQGFQRQLDGDIYFMAGSVGLLDRGHTTGYLYCREAGSVASQSSGYEPCKSATIDHGSQAFSDNPRREAYSFQKVAEHWFVFAHGPG